MTETQFQQIIQSLNDIGITSESISYTLNLYFPIFFFLIVLVCGCLFLSAFLKG